MPFALSKEGLTCSDIARRTGYGRRSITKWLTFETPPDRRRGALQPTSPLYFEAFLTQCWKDGNRRGRHLFHDITAGPELLRARMLPLNNADHHTK
jgi:hypothetical protein